MSFRFPFIAAPLSSVALALILASTQGALAGSDLPIPASEWESPPPAARPVARWWWPGGSVDPVAVREHLVAIDAAGFGAVELQPLLLGLGEDDFAADLRLRSVGEPAFRKAVAAAARDAHEIGLGFDLTLGSGWPGGLPTAKANAERQLLMASADIEGPSDIDLSLPPAPDPSYRSAVEWVLDVLGPPDAEARLVAVLAGRVGAERDGVPTLTDLRDLTSEVEAGALRWSAPEGAWRVFVFYENSTEHFVMGGAFPGEEADARVVDHLSRRGADALLQGYVDPLRAELGEGHLREVFVDSFELMGELPFTGGFQEAFRARAGYDLTPHLPLLFRRGGESKYAEMVDFFGRSGGPRYLSEQPGRAERIREDYEAVRRALFEEEFVGHFARWAHAHGLVFRLQAHGGYGDYLDTYALADVPEAEGLFGGGSFDFLKLAASAAHVSGRRWSSSEAFITLRLWGTSVSRDEMRMLAGRAYSAGINRLVYHGVSYPYRRQDGEPWFPFPGGFGRILAGPLPMSLDVDSDRLAGLAGFNRFISRLSVAMSHGQPVADVAWLRAEPIYPDAASFQLGRIEPHAGESDTTAALRARGLTHDRVSRRMLAGARLEGDEIAIGGMRYRALILDPLEVAEPVLAERIAEFAEAGFPVLALGGLPARAPGLHQAASRDEAVRAAGARAQVAVVRVKGGRSLESALEERVPGSLVEPPEGGRLEVSLAHRRSPEGDILLVFNESWSDAKVVLRFPQGGGQLLRWDPRDGFRRVLSETVGKGAEISLDLGAAETIVLTLAAAPAATHASAVAE